MFKILIIILVLYILYSWFKEIINPKEKIDKEVRIFKTKNIEKPKFEIDAETVDYEEIPKDKE